MINVVRIKWFEMKVLSMHKNVFVDSEGKYIAKTS